MSTSAAARRILSEGAAARRCARRILSAGTVRALTVKDPWIRLIGLGVKPFELRKVFVKYRGNVILCSSATPSRTDDAKRARIDYASALNYERSIKGAREPDPNGHALYVGRLAEVLRADPKSKAHARGACCKPVEGEAIWRFENVRALRIVTPVSGLLGLWYPSETLVAHVIEEGLLG